MEQQDYTPCLEVLLFKRTETIYRATQKNFLDWKVLFSYDTNVISALVNKCNYFFG